MISVRSAEERGATRLPWLDSKHTFSFNRYYDPKHMGFGPLRVINDDIIAPKGKFGMHPHEDMEIITYVVRGSIVHQDSTGGAGIIRPGDAQRMSAGTGILHSEANGSDSEAVHMYQIWIEPKEMGLKPGYEQKTFPSEERTNRLRLIAASDGREGAVTIHQDADLYAGILGQGTNVTHPLAQGRSAWVQVARGQVTVNGNRLEGGDGAAVRGEQVLEISASEHAEILLFDLA
jgi:quercetin 2,3-dioxygenase